MLATTVLRDLFGLLYGPGDATIMSLQRLLLSLGADTVK